MIDAFRTFADRFFGRGDATITVPSFDGALKPNQILEKAETIGQFDAPEDLATDGKALYIADGAAILRLDAAATTEVKRFDRAITALCCLPGGGMAVALDGRQVQVFATPSASTATATLSDPSMNAINALSPGPQGTLHRNRRLDGASLWPMGARSDGTRPHRQSPSPRHRKRGRNARSPRGCITPSGYAPPKARCSSAKAGDIVSSPSAPMEAGAPSWTICRSILRGFRRRLPAVSGSPRSPRAPSSSNSCCAKMRTGAA